MSSSLHSFERYAAKIIGYIFVCPPPHIFPRPRIHLLFQKYTFSPLGIVLATMKVATTALREFLMKSSLLQALPCGITPQRLVGQGNMDDDCLTEAEQTVVLKSFREGEPKLIFFDQEFDFLVSTACKQLLSPEHLSISRALLI